MIYVFRTGDYVVGSKGTCLVEDITTLDISGVDKKRNYYILKPVYQAGSTVYIPVDAAEQTLRPALDRDGAMQLIRDIPDIPVISIASDKLLEQTYKNMIHSNECVGLVQILKTIYQRRLKRLSAGRKLTAVDSRYSRIAEDNLYGELAIALGIPRDEVENTITRALDEENFVQNSL